MLHLEPPYTKMLATPLPRKQKVSNLLSELLRLAFYLFFGAQNVLKHELADVLTAPTVALYLKIRFTLILNNFFLFTTGFNF